MSNLKKDIEGVLDKIITSYDKWLLDTCNEVDENGESINDYINTAKYAESTTQIINLIESVVGDMEHRETEDMGLKSWTPEDYKAFGRNELRADIKSKLIGEE